MEFTCDFCGKNFSRKIKILPEFINKFACNSCSEKILESNFNDSEILTETNPVKDSHLFIISFCKDCNKPLITRASKRSKALEYGFGFCDRCNHKRLSLNPKIEMSKPGVCKMCGKFNKRRNTFGVGLDCGCNKISSSNGAKSRIKINMTPGICTKCGKYNQQRNIHGYGIECGCDKLFHIEGAKTKELPGNCVSCGAFNQKRSSLGFGIECGCQEKLMKSFSNGSFNKEKFYSEALKLTSFKSVNEFVDNFDYLKGIPGVWRIDGIDGVTYDVAQTVDIGSEMTEYLRRLNFNKYKSDTELESENLRYRYNRKKYRNIFNDCQEFNFIVVAKNIKSKSDREKIEIQEAHDRKSKYWSPAPGQIIV